MKTKSIFLIAISLGFGLVAAIGMSQVMGRNAGNDAPPEVSVFVAKDNLRVGTEITEEMLEVKSFRQDQLPEAAIASKLEEILEMKNRAPVTRGGFFYMDQLVSKQNWHDKKLPKGYRLAAIKASRTQTFHGLIRPGDRIDLLGVFRSRGQNQGAISRTFLRNIEVFAVNDKTSRNPDDEGEMNIQTIQVLVKPREAEILNLAQSLGEISVILNSDTEEDSQGSGDIGVGLADLFGEGEAEAPAVTIDDKMQQLQTPLFTDATNESDEDKPTMTIWTPNGPVEYEWTDRTALPTVKSGTPETPALTDVDATLTTTENDDLGNSDDLSENPGELDPSMLDQ